MPIIELISFSMRKPDGSVPFPNATTQQVDALIELLPDLPGCRLDYETPDGLIDSILPEQLCAQTAEEILEVDQTITDRIPELYGSNLNLVFQASES